MSLASKYVGIINQGSTCYLNSVIQTLYHLPCFRRMIFDLKPKEPNPVLTALRNLFAELAAGHNDITTTELTNAFRWDAREVAVQHDVHELIQQLFDTLETIVKGSPQETFIRDLFGGLLIYRSKAMDGVKYVSDRLESFYDLELVVEKKSSIDESLKALTTPEVIEGVSIEVTPGAAPSKHDIERTLALLKLPPVLLVHPNRVGFDMETFEPITLNNRWAFATELDLEQYTISEQGLRLDKESTEKKAKLMASSGSLPPMNVGSVYQLRTVLVHAGDANIGHHYVYVRFDNDQWVCFNDDLVEAVTPAEVTQAAFGGFTERGYGGRYRPFPNERASLLVFVNESCEATVLAEAPVSDEILALAKNIEHERHERWNTTTVPFFIGDESYIDVIDGVPGAVERLVKTVKVHSSATLLDLQGAVARMMNLPSIDCIHIGRSPVRYNYSQRYHLAEVVPEDERAARARAEAANEEAVESDETRRPPLLCFGFLRCCNRDGEVGAPVVYHNTKAVEAALQNGYELYLYSASARSLAPLTPSEQIPWGGNVVALKKGVDADSILKQLSARQFRKTDVYFVNPMNRASAVRVFSLTVADTTSYTTLQGGVYDVCKQHPSLFKSLPLTRRFIGFYEFDDHTCRPREILAPVWYRGAAGGAQVEVTLAMLCGRAKERKLYATFLPVPMEEVNVYAVVIFRLGWADMPMVYFKWEEHKMSFRDLLDLAFRQLGTAIAEPLRRRYNDMKTRQDSVCSVARLLQVDNGLVINSTANLDTLVRLGECDSVFVIDPLSLQMPDHALVDVFFCSRRRGEDYFGYPTNIVVSTEMNETGATVLLRVAKKLSIPKADEATKKWMLYVKKANSKSIKLCEAKDLLADVVKAIGGGPFEFLIDRPIAPELDGLSALDARLEESNGIVIKSSSTADLSAL